MKRLIALAFSLACTAAGGAASAHAATDSYKIDTGHSAILFCVKHLNVSNFYGRFNDFEGHFSVDEENVINSRFEVSIKARSIDTNDSKRDKHLKSPDFFNVKQFPEITFKSTKIEVQDSEHFNVTGELELLGQSRPVTAAMKRVGSGPGGRGDHRMGFEAEFTIKRSEFGMSHMLTGLGDEVRVIVSLEGIRGGDDQARGESKDDPKKDSGDGDED